MHRSGGIMVNSNFDNENSNITSLAIGGAAVAAIGVAGAAIYNKLKPKKSETHT